MEASFTGASKANSQVKRIMNTIKMSWQDALTEVQLAINCTTNRVTEVSPLEFLIGREAFGLLPIGEEDNITKETMC